MAADRADAFCSPNGQAPIKRWSAASWILPASIRQASFIKRTRMLESVTVAEQSCAPFHDFPAENWLRFVNSHRT